MKCRYRAPMTKQERDWWFRFISYTRGCICAAAVETVYEQFTFGAERIRRFVCGVRRRIEELDEEYGWERQDDERNEMVRRMERINIEYGRRFLSGTREFAGYVHDVMYMAAMITLVEDFGFGVKRDREYENKKNTLQRDSRLSRYFDAIQKKVAYVNRLNEGLRADDDRVVMFDEYLLARMRTIRLDEEFIKGEVFRWEPKRGTKKNGSCSASSAGWKEDSGRLQRLTEEMRLQAGSSTGFTGALRIPQR